MMTLVGMLEDCNLMLVGFLVCLRGLLIHNHGSLSVWSCITGLLKYCSGIICIDIIVLFLYINSFKKVPLASRNTGNVQYRNDFNWL